MKHMKKFMKIMCLLVVFALMFGLVNAFAIDNGKNKAKGEYISLPIIQVSENATIEEIEESIDEIRDAMPSVLVAIDENGVVIVAPLEDAVPDIISIIAINFVLIRSGNTTNVELLVTWTVTGGQMLSAIAFDSLRIINTSALNPIVYSNIGGSTINFPASSVGARSVRWVTIPTNVNSVRIRVTSPKAYTVPNAKWVSLLQTDELATIL
jgi:hypothetical protein